MRILHVDADPRRYGCHQICEGRIRRSRDTVAFISTRPEDPDNGLDDATDLVRRFNAVERARIGEAVRADDLVLLRLIESNKALHDALSDIFKGENVPATRGGLYGLEEADRSAALAALHRNLELFQELKI